MVTLFDEVPRKSFLRRIYRGAFGLTAVLFLWVGALSNLSIFEMHLAFHPNSLHSAGSLPVIGWTFDFYRRLIYSFMHFPQICWWATPSDEFQATQCNAYWNLLISRSLLGVSPLVLSGLFVLVCLGTYQSVFIKAQINAQKGTASHGGKILYKDSSDAFSRLYGFRVLWIELSDGKHVKVYYPDHFPKLEPGQALVAFEAGRVFGIFGGVLGSFFGTKRFLAMPYTPHVAVVRGI